jgi:tetratricopeptide (TPR) repeat protein
VTRTPLAALACFIALHAHAQFVPPVPKTITGSSTLHRVRDIPLPSPKQRWVRARSAHFLTISSASERRTRDVVGGLEMVAAALRQLDPHLAAEGDLTRLILFAGTREGLPYFDLLVGLPDTPGAFVSNPDGVGTMLVDGSRMDADRTIFHELVHNLLSNSGTKLPLWLEEGMADYFSTAVVLKGAVRIGGRVNEHYLAMHSRPLMPLPLLFAVKAGTDVGSSGFFYAESWSVVDWLMRANTAAFYRFVADIDVGADSIEALQREYHIDPILIERGFEGAQLRPLSRTTLKVPRTADPVTESITRDTAIIELATFLGGFEATRHDAERFLDTVVHDDPQNGHAVGAIAALRAKEKHYDEATKLYEQALKLTSNDPGISLDFAESLLGNAIGPFSGTVEVEDDAAPRFRRARQLATDALASGGDAARANAVIGTSYLVESDVRPGIDALLRARELRPNRYDVALNLYALLLRSGDRDSAEKLYAEISSRARTPQAIFAARAVYVREKVAIMNRLIAQNHIGEAMTVLSQLIDDTPDPGAKMDLQQQLMHLREVDDSNRQIIAFNAAAETANRGETKKAIEMLDKLLETATDSAVVRDATTLKKQLQKRSKGMRRSGAGY